MTDENGRRSIPIQNGQPGNAGDNIAEISKSAIQNMAPAEKGWILAVVITMLGSLAMITITNYFEQINRAKEIGVLLTRIEENRGEENRRLQEQNRILAQSLARQADRIGRRVNEQKYPDSVGPPAP